MAIGKEGRDEHLSQNPAARFRIGHVQWDSRGGTRKCRARRRPIPHPANWPRDFAAAIKAAGKSVELIEAPNYNHYEMGESFGNPYGPSGRAALALMQLPILG